MAKSIEELIRTIDDEPVEQTETKPKKREVALIPSMENYGNAPIEDRYGQGLWVQTRLCYCPNDAETDCRFHSPSEPGWEKCPHPETEEYRGRWLFAKNPNYGKTQPQEVAP